MARKYSIRKRRLVCSALFASLFWGLLAQLDPLGFKTASDQQSESVFMRVFSGPSYRSAAQEKITVVLIDDHYLKQLGASWPLSYIDQDLLLSDILALEPRMVFLDFLYQHDHGTRKNRDEGSKEPSKELQQFAKTIGQGSNSIPIFIPYLVEDEQGVDSCDSSTGIGGITAASLVNKDSVLPKMQRSGAEKSYVGWTGCENRYPAYILGDTDFKTPAFALFKKFCESEGASYTGCRGLKNTQKDFDSPMVVRWGTQVSDEHKSALEKAGIYCNQNTSTIFSQIVHVVKQVFQESTKKGKAERCTYTDTIHATWFLGHSEDLRSYQKDMIKDRIVLIGTQVEGVHDWVISPTNGKVPGVYLLSMALDNYLKYGPNYFREMSLRDSIFFEILMLFAITLTSALSWLTYTRWRRKKFRKEQKKMKKKYRSLIYTPTVTNRIFSTLLFKLVLPISLTLIVVGIMWSQKYAPMDWIGISILSFIANPVKITDCQQGKECGNPEEGWPFKPCALLSKIKLK